MFWRGGVCHDFSSSSHQKVAAGGGRESLLVADNSGYE